VRGGSGRGQFGEGVAGAGPDQAGELEEEVRKHRLREFGRDGAVEEHSGEESAMAARCCEEEGRVKQLERERVGSVCSSVRFVEEREKKRESTRPGAERQAAPACLTGRRGGRSGHLPDVEERGATSAGNAGGGRRDRATRGARCRGRRAAGRRSGPGGGGGV
jgi:hypothetical protein